MIQVVPDKPSRPGMQRGVFSLFGISFGETYAQFKARIGKAYPGQFPDEIIKEMWDQRNKPKQKFESPPGENAGIDNFRTPFVLRFHAAVLKRASAAMAWIASNPSRFVLGAGCLFMVLALLFPPFQQSIPFYRGDVAYQHAGFHFLFSVPLDRLTVNIGLLMAELIVIAFATISSYVILKTK